MGKQTIYKLQHKTWANGALGDFNLPRTLGHYTSDMRARLARRLHIEARSSAVNPDDRTTEHDYTITPITLDETTDDYSDDPTT